MSEHTGAARGRGAGADPAGRVRVLAWLAASAALALLTGLLPRPSHATPWFLAFGTAWGLYLLAAFAGWGSLLARWLFPAVTVDWGMRAALGLAATVAVGGLLNLAWAVSRPVVLVLLAAGVVAAAGAAMAERRALSDRLTAVLGGLRGDPVAAVLAAVAGVLLAVQLVGSVHGAINNVSAYRDFDVHDDYQAYLVFPEKMLQTGAMGADPFDVRRLVNLGGQSFLDTLVLVVLPVRALHLLDAGVALLLLVALLLGAAAERRVPRRLALLVALGALLAPHMEARGNTTAVLTGAVLLIAWFRLLDAPLLDAGRGWSNALAIALPAAALCAVKATFLPVAVFFFAFTTLCAARDRERRGGVLAEAAAAAALVFALLAPWMIALRLSSGTFLYPVFGKGDYGSVWTGNFAAVTGDFAVPPMERLDLLLRGLGGLLPVLGLAVFSHDRSRRAPVLSLALATAAGGAAVALANDPYLLRSLSRYLFPVMFAALLVLLVSAFTPDEHDRLAPARTGGALAIALVTVQAVAPVAREALVQAVANVRGGVSGDALDYPAETREMRALQASVPPGATILTRLPFPFLLDLRRNPILLDSLPGLASPPPGMPTFSGGEAVARFLRGRSIRYLAYGSRTDPLRLLDLTEKDIDDRYPRARIRWAMLVYHRDFERSAGELAATRRHTADEAQSFVLDLETWQVRPASPSAGVTVSGVERDGWTDGDARIAGLGWRPDPPARTVTVELAGWGPWGEDAARADPALAVDGLSLAFKGVRSDTLLFESPTELRRIDSVELRSATFTAAEIGGLGGDRSYGLDVRSIIVGAAAAAPPPLPAARPGPLVPGDASHAAGMFADNNWTNGDALLDGCRLAVPAGSRFLAVAIGPAHPFREDAARLAVTIEANGIPLAFDHAEGAALLFRLYQGVRRIDRLRVRSSTFVPASLGIGADQRRLGVPLESIAIRP